MRLTWAWGSASVGTIARRLGRTPRAIVDRAKRLRLPAPRSGSESITALANRTGYSRSRIRGAMERLGIGARRQVTTTHLEHAGKRQRGRGRRTALTEGEVRQILDFLAAYPDGKRILRAVQGQWGSPNHRGGFKPDACIDCERNDVPYWAGGRCRRCDRLWRAGKLSSMT